MCVVVEVGAADDCRCVDSVADVDNFFYDLWGFLGGFHGRTAKKAGLVGHSGAHFDPDNIDAAVGHSCRSRRLRGDCLQNGIHPD